ncbi:hypothetical protein FRC10_002801 [Ceratobasidium sp. 414]|nr:hypothetical protein FRC10_002801 [Ceratobasidium sp. 414]
MSDTANKQDSGKPIDEYVEHHDPQARILAVKRLHDGQDHNSSDHRLVVDIKEAEREYGSDVAAALKTAEDGMTILWPQPRDDPDDPLNASAPFVFTPNSSLFPLSAQFNTTVTNVNNL